MRPARLLIGVPLLLILAQAAAAQEERHKVLYTATVSAPEAEVRSGPSTNPDLYPTNKLRRGDTVEVVKELEGGWLAVVPPPGSFSWINTRFLEQQSDNRVIWRVVTDVPVPVLYGSSLRNEKPTVEGAKVPRGTLVASIGPAKAADDGMWMPIEPPPGELRYLQAHLVTKNGTAAAPPTGGTPVPPTPAGGSGTPVAAIPVSNRTSTSSFAQPGQAVDPVGPASRWLPGQQAEQSSNRAAAAAPQPVQPANAVQPIPPANERLAPIPATLQASLRQPGCVPCQTTSSSSGQLERVGPGWLARSAWWLDGQKTFTLIDQQGRVRMYVTGQPGMDLEPWLGRYVSLTGAVYYRGDLRNYHVKTVQVQPMQ
jgi:hypothetical protein